MLNSKPTAWGMILTMLNSKPAAWGGMILTILVIIVLSVFKTVWWTFIPFFFMFMEAFCELVAVYIMRLSPSAAKTLQLCAFVFGILTVLAIIGVFIAWQVIIP